MNKDFKAGKSKVLVVGRMFDAEKKRLLKLWEPIRDALQEKEDIVKREKERVAAEKQKAKEQRHLNQVQQVIDAGAVFNGIAYVYGEGKITNNEIWNYIDNDPAMTMKWNCLIEDITKWKSKEDALKVEKARKKKEEDARQAEIAEDNRISQNKLDKQREEQAAEAKKIKDAQDKLDADKKAEEARKAQEKINAEFKAEQIKQQKLNEKLIEEAKIKFAADVKKKAEEGEKKRLAEIEAKRKLQPDKKKLQTLAQEMLSFWEEQEPEIKLEKAGDILKEEKEAFFKVAENLQTKSEEL